MISNKEQCSSIVPTKFGAVGNGLVDDTAAVQAALDDAINGSYVELANRTYAVRHLFVRNGVAGLHGPGKLIGIGKEAILDVSGENGKPLESFKVSGITIKAGTSPIAIFLKHARNVHIQECYIYGLMDSSTGIMVDEYCEDIVISGCQIIAPITPLRSLVCISISSALFDAYAGYFTNPAGIIKCPPASTHNILLENNCVIGGTHGIAVANVYSTKIISNTIAYSQHRNINLCPAACGNIIKDNMLLEAGSSAVAMAYGSNENNVINNEIFSCSTHAGYDRDAIHSYVACQCNKIEKNRIVGDFRYGIYLAVDSVGTLVRANMIQFEPNVRLADDFQVGIVLENDWPPRPLPKEALYSRQNWAAINGMQWAYGETSATLLLKIMWPIAHVVSMRLKLGILIRSGTIAGYLIA